MSRVTINKDKLDDIVSQRFWSRGVVSAAALQKAVESTRTGNDVLDGRSFSALLNVLGISLNKLVRPRGSCKNSKFECDLDLSFHHLEFFRHIDKYVLNHDVTSTGVSRSHSSLLVTIRW